MSATGETPRQQVPILTKHEALTSGQSRPNNSLDVHAQLSLCQFNDQGCVTERLGCEIGPTC